MKITYAPIVLFVYKRLDHLRLVINSLKDNIGANHSKLIIYSDGYKNFDDKNQVLEVRKFLKSIEGFESVKIIERCDNLGLSRSIILGVTETLKEFDRAIILEDDLVTSPNFLEYMNCALNHYRNDERVASIHGYVYPTKESLPSTFFIKGADCWGWGTWKRAWALFNEDGLSLRAAIESSGLKSEFDFGNSYPYFQMLQDNIDGKNDSWAIRWYATAFIHNLLTLYPGRSLVSNIGNDGSGTHKDLSTIFDTKLISYKVPVGGVAVEESLVGRLAFTKYFKRNLGEISPLHKLIRILKKKLKSLLYV